MIALRQHQRPIGLLDPEAGAYAGMQQQLLTHMGIAGSSLAQALLDGVSAAAKLPKIVLDQVALADPETCGRCPCESDNNGLIGRQLQLTLQAAKQLLALGSRRCHGPFSR